MSEKHAISLAAQSRTHQKKQVSHLRKAGIIPGVVYGHGKDTQSVQIKLFDIDRIYKSAGESTLIDLSIDEQSPIKVLIHDIAHDIITDTIQHVDFYAVNMKEKIHAEVVLHFIGVSQAVKEAGGTLVKNKDHIAIKCLPQDLISEKEIDIASLGTFEDVIHVSDITFPEGIEVLDEPENVIALVTPPRTEEELAELNQVVTEDVSAVEGIADKPADEEAASTDKAGETTTESK